MTRDRCGALHSCFQDFLQRERMGKCLNRRPLLVHEDDELQPPLQPALTVLEARWRAPPVKPAGV